MANRRVTDLDPIVTAPVSGVMHFVDTTDNTQNAAGSSFKVTKADFLKENTAAILLNTDKVGITPAQATAITNNTVKVGITTDQSASLISVQDIISGPYVPILTKISTSTSINFVMATDGIVRGVPFRIRCRNADNSIPTSVNYQQRSDTGNLAQSTLPLDSNGDGVITVTQINATIVSFPNIVVGFTVSIIKRSDSVPTTLGKLRKDTVITQFFDGGFSLPNAWIGSATTITGAISANLVTSARNYLLATINNAKFASFPHPNDNVSTSLFLNSSFQLIEKVANSVSYRVNYPIPSGAKYLLAGSNAIDDNSQNYIILKENEDQVITDDYIQRYEEGIQLTLPTQIALVAGVNLQLFKDSFVSCSSEDAYSFKIEADSSTDLYTGENLTQLLKTAGNTNTEQNLTFKLLDNQLRTIVQDSVKIVHTTKKTSPSTKKNVLIIGDSFTEQAYYPAELSWRLSAKNGLRKAGNAAAGIPSVTAAPTVLSDNLTNLNYIGTRPPTDAGIYLEGWSGKTYEFFLGKDADGLANSPFMTSGSFNVNTYMNNLIINNGSTLNLVTGDKIDIVCVILGTNRQSESNNIRQFINGFISHNPNVKLLIAGKVINAPYNQNFKNITSALNYNKRVENICAEFARCYYVDILSQYDRMNNSAGLIEVNANNRNSTKKRFTNSSVEIVHPNANGYYQIADAFYSAFHYFALV